MENAPPTFSSVLAGHLDMLLDVMHLRAHSTGESVFAGRAAFLIAHGIEYVSG